MKLIRWKVTTFDEYDAPTVVHIDSCTLKKLDNRTVEADGVKIVFEHGFAVTSVPRIEEDTITLGYIPCEFSFPVVRGIRNVLDRPIITPQEVVGDGIPLFSGVHPRPSLWKRIVTWFRTPRLSDNFE